jgi:prepilin-type N-terminal cleavage/methylation domain-containing protein
MRSRRAFTLLELLVAMGIFTILGTSLMVILRGGLSTWRRAEARQETFAGAESVLAQLSEDLRSLVPPHDSPDGGTGAVEARLLCDTDDVGRPRLFLVRTIKAESEHPITGLAGTTIGADRVVDYRDDLQEARDARLRATGGMLEVAWVLGPGDVLYRGIKGPPGPPGSLFADEDPYELAPLTPIVPTATPAAAPTDDGPALLRPFATDVIHFDLRFWHQHATTWSVSEPPRRWPDVDQQERSGPLLYWDSTRASLQPADPDRRRFDTFLAAASITDPRDDIFPAKVRVEVTLREAPAAGSVTVLTASVDASATELRVQDPGRLPPSGHVLLEREWVRYDRVERGRVIVAEGGRGARGTTAAPHGIVEATVGRTFVAIIDIPAWREDWSERRR